MVALAVLCYMYVLILIIVTVFEVIHGISSDKHRHIYFIKRIKMLLIVAVTGS
jgi:hypothetical protein